MAGPRPKRYRVSGYDPNGDIMAFETDSRERAKDMEAQWREDLRDVTLDRQRAV